MFKSRFISAEDHLNYKGNHVISYPNDRISFQTNNGTFSIHVVNPSYFKTLTVKNS